MAIVRIPLRQRPIQNGEEEQLPYQIMVKRKDGSVRADFAIFPGDPPDAGTELELRSGNSTMRVKVVAVRDMPTGLAMVEVQEA
jgi:hypothetical protein